MTGVRRSRWRCDTAPGTSAGAGPTDRHQPEQGNREPLTAGPRCALARAAPVLAGNRLRAARPAAQASTGWSRRSTATASCCRCGEPSARASLPSEAPPAFPWTWLATCLWWIQATAASKRCVAVHAAVQAALRRPAPAPPEAGRRWAEPSGGRGGGAQRLACRTRGALAPVEAAGGIVPQLHMSTSACLPQPVMTPPGLRRTPCAPQFRPNGRFIFATYGGCVGKVSCAPHVPGGGGGGRAGGGGGRGGRARARGTRAGMVGEERWRMGVQALAPC